MAVPSVGRWCGPTVSAFRVKNCRLISAPSFVILFDPTLFLLWQAQCEEATDCYKHLRQHHVCLERTVQPVRVNAGRIWLVWAPVAGTKVPRAFPHMHRNLLRMVGCSAPDRIC